MNQRRADVLIIGFYEDLVADLLRSDAVGVVHVLEEPDLLAEAARPYRENPRVRFVAGQYQQSSDGAAVAIDMYRRRQYNLVIPGREYGVRLAHRIAEKLGLPTPGGVACEASTDKLALRQLTAGTRLCHGRYASITSAADIRRMFDGRTLMLKPRSRHGSIGVVQVRSAGEIQSQWDSVLSSAQQGAVTAERALSWEYMAEDFVTGFAEVSIESVVHDGEIIFSNVTLKSMNGTLHYSPTGHTIPGPVTATEIRSLRQAERRLLELLGMRVGILHSEWICRQDAPHLVEFAARYPGGKLARAIEAVYGANLADLWINALLGRLTARVGHPDGFAAIGYMTCPPGIISNVRGEDFLKNAPWVAEYKVSAAIGKRVYTMNSFMDRLGYYICVAPSLGELAERMSAAAAAVTVSSVPVPPGSSADMS